MNGLKFIFDVFVVNVCVYCLLYGEIVYYIYLLCFVCYSFKCIGLKWNN